MSHKTRDALLARGVSTASTEAALVNGYTLKSLRQSCTQELVKLGFSRSEITAISRGARPPIPTVLVTKLLYTSKLTCCVCRDNSKPIVIHHIEPWSVSKDHSETNLVVLCLEHHGEAHTTRSLSMNLTSQRIRSLKQEWLAVALKSDARAILGLAEIEGGRWDYINTDRLIELASALNISLPDVTGFKQLRSYGMVDDDGLLLPLVELTNRWTIGELDALITTDSWVAVQTTIYFKNQTNLLEGRNQIRRGFRRRRGIELEFYFDAWDTTSSSSSLFLSGYRTAMAVLQIRSIHRTESKLKVLGSCLAIGGRFKDGRLNTGQSLPPSKWTSYSASIDADDSGLHSPR